MKSTGMIRKIDELGRIVIPKEIRRTFDLKDNVDSLEIFVDENQIILRKYQPSCMFCDNVDNLTIFKDHNICADCLKEIAEKTK